MQRALLCNYLMTGRLVGHYRVLEKIGAGGMGEVFRARDERLGRDVALKLISPASSDNPDHLHRFEQEARAAAALNHPNILAIYDVGFDGDVPYIVSELLVGKTLRQRFSEGPIPVREGAEYALQIAQGLIAAHGRLIVHRDLKPENLFLTNEGRVKILDFGVAKLQVPPEDKRNIENLPTVTKQGAVIGTVAYMSPEQLRGKPVDHRSDIFSFGAILYEMLSAQRAFRGETEVDTMTAVLREDPPDSNLEQAAIPPGYRDIVKHCLEKDPDNRFQSAKDLAFALQTLSGSSPVRAGSSIIQPRTRTRAVLPWALVALLAAATVLLLIVQSLPPAPPPSYERLTYQAGTIFAARFSPHGDVVYSAAWNGSPVQIFSTVGKTRQAQQLSLNNADLLAISPDSELAITLHGTHTGQLEVADGMLASAPLAGGSPREVLSDVRWADWNKEDKLAVVRSVDGHSRLEYPIGTVLFQSSGWISNIRFSPVDDRIAFMDHPAMWDNRGSVCVVDFSGHVQTLSAGWESENGVAWRPDGKEIWFTAIEKGSNLKLMAVSLAGRTRQILDLPVGIILQDIAADGRVLITLKSQRLAMGFSTLGSKEDVDLSWHDWNVAKGISPDGKFVLFEDASEAAGPGYSVALRKLDGSLPVRLGEGSAGGLSPDGKWAISISTGKAEKITLLPTGAGQPRSVEVTGLEHINNGYARFLPDGKRLVVNGNELGHTARCYVLAVTGGNFKPITPEGTRCGPSSPDGHFIVGTAADSSLALYPIDGGAARAFPSPQPGFVPLLWSEDGSSLYGYRQGELPSKIYKVNIATGKEIVVKELRPGAPAGVVNVAPIVVSLDGTRFAYSYNVTLSVLFLVYGLH